MKMIQGQRQKYRQRTIPNITSAAQRDLTGNFENSIPDDDDYIFYLRSINVYYCGICSYFLKLLRKLFLECHVWPIFNRQ